MRFPAILSVSLFLFFLLPPAEAQTDIPWLRGQWEGVGYQAPTDSKWSIELRYDSTESRLVISYPSLECGGQWDLVENREGYAEFREHISHGQENCDNNVQVIVTQISEEFISVAYFLPEYYDGVVAYSVLHRVPDKKYLKVPSGPVKKT